MIPKIGVDLVDLRRIDEHLISKVLSPSEIEEISKISNPLARCQFIGSRFAAKEALFKATQTTLSMSEVTVSHRSTGEPYFVQYPSVSLSLSHETDFAIAFVMTDNM